MNITSATTTDVPHIVRLLNSTPELQANPDYHYDEIYVLSHLNNPMHCMLVCKEGEELLGVLAAEMWEDKHNAFISNIAIAQGSRRVGMGSQLYDEFEKICTKKGFHSINYLVLTDNTKMQAWSEKKGFEKGHALYYYEKKI